MRIVLLFLTFSNRISLNDILSHSFMAFNMCSSTSIFPAIIAVMRGVFPIALLTEMLAPLLNKHKVNYASLN